MVSFMLTMLVHLLHKDVFVAYARYRDVCTHILCEGTYCWMCVHDWIEPVK
jgi:hypothetical protein